MVRLAKMLGMVPHIKKQKKKTSLITKMRPYVKQCTRHTSRLYAKKKFKNFFVNILGLSLFLKALLRKAFITNVNNHFNRLVKVHKKIFEKIFIMLSYCYRPCCIICLYKIFTRHNVEAHVPLLNMHK